MMRGLAWQFFAMLRHDLEASTLPLWKIMLHYYQIKDMHKVEQMFQEGIVQGPAISLPLKPMYIEWLVLAKGKFTYIVLN